MPRSLTRPLQFVTCAALLLLSGCRVGLEVGLDVERDGGGRLAVALSADAEAVRRAAEAGADPLALVATAGRELEGDGWTTTDTDEPDGGRRVELATAFADPEELEAVSAALAQALDAPEVRLLEPVRVTLTDETVAVDGGAGLVLTPVVEEYGLTPEEAVARLAEAVDYRVVVTMPGAVTASTATSVTEDGTLVWEIAPGGTADVQVEGERPGAPLVLLVGAGVAGAGVGAAVLLARRRRDEPALR